MLSSNNEVIIGLATTENISKLNVNNDNSNRVNLTKPVKNTQVILHSNPKKEIKK